MYDITLKKACVKKIDKQLPEIEFITVILPDDSTAKAFNYVHLTGGINTGDYVIINTTAGDLSLGTGGYHFVCANLDNGFNKHSNDDPEHDNNFSNEMNKTPGHIMKLRYTPFQLRTLSIEEKDSPYHDIINNFNTLEGLPVVILPLHSLLAPLVVTYKYYFPDNKIVYIMTEGGSLALPFSNLVRELTAKEYINSTITIGNAFGGDYEAVNIFTGLAAAKEVIKADLIVVGMGPGITGTGTRLGYSGVENLFTYQAVKILQGKGIIVPRISLVDNRKRHYGISHHTITLLQDLLKEEVELAFPDIEIIKSEVESYRLQKKHKIEYFPIEEINDILTTSKIEFNSMGRKYDDDPLFFINGGLAVYKVKS